MKEILIVSWNGEGEGGVERVTHYARMAWQDRYKITIIDLEMVKSDKKYDIWLGLHYALDALVVSAYTNAYIRKKLKKMKREDLIVVTQGYNAPLVEADVAFAHGTMRMFHIKTFNDHRWHFSQFFEMRSWNKSKRLIAVGEHVKQEAIDLYHVSQDKIHIIENCVDTDIFYPLQEKEYEAHNTILFCGRLFPVKGLDKLLELARLLEEQDELSLLIAAPISMNAELFANMRHTKVMIGLKRDEMNAFYNAGSVMFFPSLYEGWELVTLECLSAGVPVLGRDVGAAGDLWHDGQRGVKLMSDDMQENLSAIRKLAGQYRDMKDRMSLHEDMVEKYSLSQYKNKLNAFLKDNQRK